MSCKIIFQHNYEKKEYCKFTKNRSLQYYNNLKNYLFDIGIKEIKYTDFSSIIRYEKTLRKELYIMLTTIEEFTISKICSNYKMYGSFDIGNSVGKLNKDINFNCIKKEINNDIELYNRLKLSFGELIKFIESLHDFPYSHLELESYKSSKELRNMVMHHRLLTFYPYDNFTELKKIIENKVKCSINLLPDDYKLNWINRINNLNINNNVHFIKIHI